MTIPRYADAACATPAASGSPLTEDGVIRACHKRPVSAQQIKDLVDSVETEIYNKGEREIPTTEIGEMVMNRIKTLDAVAYVRFASVYREFKDVETFMDEIRKMM